MGPGGGRGCACGDLRRWSAEQVHGAGPGQVIAAEGVHRGLHLGWIVPWTGTYKAQATVGTLKPALQTATWKGQLVAVPDNTNTQLLWYRSDLVPTPPTTWAQMIADAEQLAKEGKPHYIEIQSGEALAVARRPQREE